MDIIYKTIGAVFSVIIIFVGGLAVNISDAAEVQTNNYFESVSKTVIESNYNEEIIEALIQEAEEQGHVLTIEVYGSDNPGAKRYADIRLQYKYNVKLFNISIDKTKQKVL